MPSFGFGECGLISGGFILGFSLLFIGSAINLFFSSALIYFLLFLYNRIDLRRDQIIQIMQNYGDPDGSRPESNRAHDWTENKTGITNLICQFSFRKKENIFEMP
jgi:hypothetical protein